MKYIIFKDQKTGNKTAMVFDKVIVHRDVARGGMGVDRDVARGGMGVDRERLPVSAGFVSRDTEGKLYTYGYSESMNMKPDPDDVDILSLYLHLLVG